MGNQIRLDINHMMADFIGEKGISREELTALEPQMKKAYAMVEAGRGKGMQGWMDLPYNQEEIVSSIEKCAAKVRDEFESFVVLGIGGSALGPAAVQQALNTALLRIGIRGDQSLLELVRFGVHFGKSFAELVQLVAGAPIRRRLFHEIPIKHLNRRGEAGTGAVGNQRADSQCQ